MEYFVVGSHKRLHLLSVRTHKQRGGSDETGYRLTRKASDSCTLSAAMAASEAYTRIGCLDSLPAAIETDSASVFCIWTLAAEPQNELVVSDNPPQPRQDSFPVQHKQVSTIAPSAQVDRRRRRDPKLL